MKKLFALSAPNLKPPRVVEAIKHDVRKYLKRERRKPCPEGTDFWDFDCSTGPDAAHAELTHVGDVNAAIDQASAASWEAIYIEILAKPGHRAKKAGDSKPDPIEDR